MVALQIFITNKGNKIYADNGTGANSDLAVFQPEIADGYFMIM